MGAVQTKRLRSRVFLLLLISFGITVASVYASHSKCNLNGRSIIRVPGKPSVPKELIDNIVPMMRSIEPPFKMSVCAIYRNEAKNLAQWIVYNYLLGVQHFYLLDNDSDDDSTAVLQPFIDMNLVTRLDWGGPHHEMLTKQFAYCSNATMFAPITEWMGLYEVDEYVVMPGWDFNENIFLDKDTTTFPLHRFLDDYKASRCGGVWLDRLNFDSNGHKERPNGLIMSEFTSRVISVKHPVVFGKNIILYDGLSEVVGGHNILAKEGWNRCYADHTIVEGSMTNLTHHVYEPIRMHHYLSLSYNECTGKLDMLKQRSSVDDWRVVQGQRFCDDNMVGTEVYKREEHVQDRTLADSKYPVVVSGLVDYIMRDVKI